MGRDTGFRPDSTPEKMAMNADKNRGRLDCGMPGQHLLSSSSRNREIPTRRSATMRLVPDVRDRLGGFQREDFVYVENSRTGVVARAGRGVR